MSRLIKLTLRQRKREAGGPDVSTYDPIDAS